MRDIVKRLRGMKVPLDTGPGVMIHPTAAEAAAEIEKLRHEIAIMTHGIELENEKLREELARSKQYNKLLNLEKENFRLKEELAAARQQQDDMAKAYGLLAMEFAAAKAVIKETAYGEHGAYSCCWGIGEHKEGCPVPKLLSEVEGK